MYLSPRSENGELRRIYLDDQADKTMFFSKPGEDDANDHIDSDTPRSGVATPKPDPSDKRLPGIMHSYFQVGLNSGSSENPISVPLETPAIGTEAENPPVLHVRETTTELDENLSATGSSSRENSSGDSEGSPYLLPHEKTERRASSAADGASHNPHPYPTPPVSKPPSVRKLKFNDSTAEDGEAANPELASPTSQISLPHHKTISESILPKFGASSMLKTLSNILTPSNVLASHISTPKEPTPTTTEPDTPIHSRIASGSVSDSLSYDMLKKLTIGDEKSHPATPTRALSNNTSTSDTSDHGHEQVHKRPSGLSETKSSSSDIGGAPVRAPRGKLTVKIAEARGLRRSKDPYVVAVFQRNELVSKGPRSEDEDDEDEDATISPPPGGIPISRQPSDSGRPMAIPMKSRQSSNTSDPEPRDFKVKSRRSMTNPKWDTEAVFDVVGDDSRVSISVYDRGTLTEDFLGHVDFNPELSEYDTAPVKGWYPLRDRKGEEDSSIGEVYVEISFERTDKRHYGPEDFQILKLIGKGTFGQVYQVRKKDTKRIYAMKVLQKKVIVQKKEVAHTVGERNILVRTAMTESPFIVGLKFSFQTPTDLYLVTDYMSGGELFWHLQKEGRFDEKRAKFYIAELILALQHLHVHDIVYRDLKPENILLDANGHIALCDFGLSKANLTKNDTTNTFCGTTEYLAPEVLLDEAGYTKMVDFWSLGVLVFEMCCGWSPFYAEDTQQMYKNIAFGKVRFPRDTLSTEGRNFVKGLLNRNPKHRLGAIDDAEELKRHPFFADIDWEALTKKLITPPFKPKLKSETDTSNFDPEFTNALNGASSLNARAAALAAGIVTSTPLSPGMQANFKGFTFVDENSIDDHFQDRTKYDIDEMDEAWDDTKTKRMSGMSGIVKSHNNEDSSMINGEHFDM
ncbi:AGC/AKT protein kinase [Pseudogymnoascus sp. 05NY08]|nr:AGC/AKT protein kinase [Pseudogymnoascus sp. 05NY08]